MLQWLQHHVGGRAECCDIVDSQKSVVVLAQADVRLSELCSMQPMAVEVVGCLEREE
jgi:hypothetical protein